MVTSSLSASLCDAMDDEVDCLLTGHVLLTEQPRGGALCLGEYRHKKLSAGPGPLRHIDGTTEVNVDSSASREFYSFCDRPK
jgi:hypothetical protein